MAWNLSARPGHPKGGEAMGMRAVFSLLEAWAKALIPPRLIYPRSILTGLTGGLPSRMLRMDCITCSAAVMGLVWADTWGQMVILGCVQRGLSGGSGSVRNTSKHAPDKCPPSMASISAPSSTCKPRPQLIKYAFFLNFLKVAAENRSRVALVRGRMDTT